MVQTGVDVRNLLKYLVSVGMILLSTTPIIDQNENISMKLRRTLVKLADEQRKEEEIPEINYSGIQGRINGHNQSRWSQQQNQKEMLIRATRAKFKRLISVNPCGRYLLWGGLKPTFY